MKLSIHFCSRLFPLFLFTLIIFSSCEEKPNYDRPQEMWIFRSVMDQKARMLTVALNDGLWVTYDLQTAQMYKAWKGGVKFDGAVYTTSHGPQPTSEGYSYYTDNNSEWLSVQDLDTVVLESKHRGHKIVDGQAVVMYALSNGNAFIEVEETPEHIKRGSQNGFSRTYNVQGLKEGQQLLLKTAVTSIQLERDLASKGGQFVVASKNEDQYAEGTLARFNGHFVMSNGSSELKVFYHPGFDKIAQNFREETEDTKLEIHPGAKLIEESDCHACHNENLKTVGPAYISIARKYIDSEKSIGDLSQKIIKGGSGVWGQTMMSPHSSLSREDASTMVQYILSLDNNENQSKWDKTLLGEKSRVLKLEDDYVGASKSTGLMANYYRITEPVNADDIIKNQDPIRNGPVENVHSWGDDFDINGDQFIIEYSGYITIDNEDNYGFRLINNNNAKVFLADQLLFDHPGLNELEELGSEAYLKVGKHPIKVILQKNNNWTLISLQWFNKEKESYELIPNEKFSFDKSNIKKTIDYTPLADLVKNIPGDAQALSGLHPAFDLFQARPDEFLPKVGGIDFLSNGGMVICTWDSLGPVYLIENYMTGEPDKITVKRIASGLAEPLGIKVVDDVIYVLQKQELTRLIDNDGDQIIDEYQTVSDDWKVSSNFHEFAFGLEYQDGYFYGTLATAIMPGGASANPQIPDRGKVIKISEKDGSVEFIAHGLRTPNGIGFGTDNKLFVADNQGDWLPASKIVEVDEGSWYGSRSVDFEGTADLEETLPVVWLPQDEIGNSPSQPIGIDYGPYKGQMVHGEVTHGGLKRVYAERIEGRLQGAVFRFTLGLEAGVNRLSKAPDGSLMIGGVGNPGNWSHAKNGWYGLQRMQYNNTCVFEMLKVNAKTNGFEIEFTEAIKPGQNISAEDFLIQQWFYLPTKEYGGPKMELETLKAKNFYMSEDRKKVFFELDGLKENHVVYFRIVKPFASELDNELWTTEAWYTLNKIPKNTPGFTNDYTPNHNALTASEQADGWKMLFDGKSLGHFRNFKKETVGKKWKVDEGNLHFVGKDKGDKAWQAKEGGDILITDQAYENYELNIEWKVSKNGNSGIIYNVIESDEYDYVWNTGPEMQVLDNVGHPDGQIKIHRAGDLYDLIPCKFVTANGPGEWNRAKLIVNKGHVEHWLNGYKVVEFDLWTPEWDAMVANSKFADFKGFGTGKKGHIALQDHGDKVWFRNMKIKAL